MGNGAKYSQSTATQTLPSYLQDAYQNIVGRAQGVASQGYTPYTGGFTPDQQTAFQNIGSLWGSSNPSFNNASTALSTSMVPTYGTVGAYMSPYISNVADAMKANIQETNAQQQQGVIGNAIAKGAYGGNRVGVAQAELARQQGLASNQALADLYNTGYGTALGAAQADKQAALNAASGYSNLGSTQMQTGLAQAGAQLGAGTQQQQFNYQQYLNALAFPYQQTSWLASTVGNLAPSAGGTTTQQTPQGNIFSQLLGAGLGVASLFHDGGRVGAANGGVMGTLPYANDNGMFPSFMGASVGTPYAANDNGMFPSYVPQVAAAGGGHGFPTIQPMDDTGTDPLAQYSSTMKEGASNIKNWLTPKPTLHAGYNLNTGGVVPTGYYRGGNVQSDNIIDRRDWNSFVHERHVGLPADHFTRKGYANGGLTDDDVANLYAGILKPEGGLVGGASLPQAVARAKAPVIDATAPIDADRLGLGMGNSSSEPDALAYSPTPDDRGLNVPPINATGLSTVAVPQPISSGSAGVVPFTTGEQFTTTPTPGYSQNIGDAWKSLQEGNGLNLSPDVKQSLLAAGLGMMASRSPFALQGIGEGGLKGIEAWNARQALERENAAARASNAMTGAQIAQTAAQTGMLGAETGRTQQQTVLDRYDFTPTMAGMMVTNKVDPTQSQIIPFNQFKGWASRNGIDPSQTPNGGEPPATMVNTDEGIRFNVNPPANVAPSGMAWNDTGRGIIGGQTAAALDQARTASQAANETTLQLSALKNAAKNLPSSGPLVPGAWAEIRGGIAKNLNTIASMANMKLPFDPNQVGSIEEMNKLTTQFGFALAKTTGSDVAASVISQGLAAVPSIENTPQGFKSITALIQSSLNRTRDYYDFLQKWADKTGGDTTGAADYFNKIAPPSAYSRSAILSTAIVPKTQSDIDNAPAGTLFNVGGKLMVK